MNQIKTYLKDPYNWVQLVCCGVLWWIPQFSVFSWQFIVYVIALSAYGASNWMQGFLEGLG